MPPKVRFTREQVINAGIDLVRCGEEISARSLGKNLSSSPQPIFSYFENMEALQKAVLDEAKNIYWQYIQSGLQQPVPFKGAGMGHLYFASQEPELFMFLFMTDRGEQTVPHFLFKNGVNSENVLSALEKYHNINKEKAENIYNHLSVYTHGLAILFAQKTCIFTLEEAEKMISELFCALIKAK